MKKNLTIVALFLISMLIVLVSVFVVILNQSIVKSPSGIVFNVPAGMSKQTFVTELNRQGIVKYVWLYEMYVSAHVNTPLKAGEYMFPKASSLSSIWQQVALGHGFYYRAFTIIPGTTFAQLRQALDSSDAIKHLTNGSSNDAIMAFLGHPGMQPEGQFFPETYYYTRGDQDLVILQRAFDLMQNRLNEAWQSRSSDNPFKTMNDALIAASIVEKEAYLDAERPIIAGVMINRLAINMPLQFDPTVIYGLGSRYDGKIYKKDLQEDTPYNTYLRKGLTPTPISMPSMSSINAVMHPAKHDFLYFVAKGDGGHQFSATLQAHVIAVAAARARESGGDFFNSDLIRQYILRLASMTALETKYGTR